jgi:hypothetical protein
LEFPSGSSEIGPVALEGRGWFYNVLLTGTLPQGTDASQYGIVQTVKSKSTFVTDDGKTHKLSIGPKKESIAPNPECSKCSTAKGNVLYGIDSPGPHNQIGGRFAVSVTSSFKFKSWMVNHQGKQVSPAIRWYVNIVVTQGEVKTNAAGVE